MPKFICGAAGALALCKDCLHAEPHEWVFAHGCANNTWCIKKIADARKEAGEVPTELPSCACVECKDPSFAEKAQEAVDGVIEDTIKKVVEEEGEL